MWQLTAKCVVQTEKQRLIWAYKILFLDVLFPLNLRKVIFCDSDQVVRGNMADLWNMDLKVNQLYPAAPATGCTVDFCMLFVWPSCTCSWCPLA